MPEDSQRVLVVDDNRTIRLMIREELEGGGYEVIEARDGLEAIVQAVSDTPPDLIALDLEMPKMGGFETCRTLRQERYAKLISKGNGQRVPVIFVTGNDTMEERKKGFDLGAADFVTKPFTKGELLAVVDQILRPGQATTDFLAAVIDDSPLARKIVTDCLSREGIEVIQAENGEQGFELIKDHAESLDIIITDLVMPGMDGKDLCRRIRQELGLKDTPIIFLTGMSDVSELLEIFKSGGSDYLVKPFAKEELIARVGVHIERNNINRRLKQTILELQEANRTIEKISTLDPLTSCFNRRYLNKQFPKELKRSVRYNNPLSIILADIDHFKAINDTFGHQCGDEVLVHFVQTIQKRIRGGVDWIARFGGEEFLIVVPETSPANAFKVAEKLRQAIARTPYVCAEEEIGITASFGVTGFDRVREEHPEMDTIFNQADRNLYSAKEKGRNRVVC